ncbi:hypothetical protein BDN71DRAFT_975898 [Pleurotus eryngii]|uniref:Uncharacterized protein n=1 Tax=Pleurotus eryngii TaxID=5323 RepID=A0A9P5ZVD5_PLEER|nr:hypothetical protein BDN71DRAFT_975898 [Pleurotus eryngii]
MEHINSVSHSLALALCRGSLLRFALLVGILLVRNCLRHSKSTKSSGCKSLCPLFVGIAITRLRRPQSARSHITSLARAQISILSPQLSITQLIKASRASPPPSSRQPFASNSRRLRVCVLSVQSGVVDVNGDLRACPSDLVDIGCMLCGHWCTQRARSVVDTSICTIHGCWMSATSQVVRLGLVRRSFRRVKTMLVVVSVAQECIDDAVSLESSSTSIAYSAAPYATKCWCRSRDLYDASFACSTCPTR